MKYVLAFTALLALVGFVGFTHAADTKAPKPKKGHFVKVDDKVVTYKGGLKGKGEDHTVKIDDNTKVTLDGKDATIADLKADVYIEITEKEGTATLIAALSVTPTEAPKTQKSAPATQPSSK